MRWMFFIPVNLFIYLLLMFLAWYPYDWFGAFGLYVFCTFIGFGGAVAGVFTPDQKISKTIFTVILAFVVSLYIFGAVKTDWFPILDFLFFLALSTFSFLVTYWFDLDSL